MAEAEIPVHIPLTVNVCGLHCSQEDSGNWQVIVEEFKTRFSSCCSSSQGPHLRTAAGTPLCGADVACLGQGHGREKASLCEGLCPSQEPAEEVLGTYVSRVRGTFGGQSPQFAQHDHYPYFCILEVRPARMPTLALKNGSPCWSGKVSGSSASSCSSLTCVPGLLCGLFLEERELGAALAKAWPAPRKQRREAVTWWCSAFAHQG